MFYFQLIQLAEGTNNGLNNSRKTQLVGNKNATALAKNNKKISNGDIASEYGGPDDSDSEWKVNRNERRNTNLFSY